MKKLLFMLAAVFCCTLMATSLISCSEEDEYPAGPHKYLVTVNAKETQMSIDEINMVFGTYKDALGLKTLSDLSEFTANSDEEVIAGCKKAEAELNTMEFKGKGRFETMNGTTGKIIHVWEN